MVIIVPNLPYNMPLPISKAEKIARFDPGAPGNTTSGLFGLPFDYTDSEIIVIPIPWEVTTSYRAGTAQGPEAILQASPQLDLFDFDVPDAWKIGVHLLPVNQEWKHKNMLLRSKAEHYIGYIERGGRIEGNIHLQSVLAEINAACQHLNEWVERLSLKIMADGKIPAVLGGEHSSPLGLLSALSRTYPAFGILQIDAHADLRKNYEGFTYSHASIMYNALKFKQVSKLVSVGVRDICDEEVTLTQQQNGRVVPFYNQQIRERTDIYRNATWASVCNEIVQHLPDKVYISFDIDGLDPKLCPNTGTPVPGGLQMEEAFYLLRQVVLSGREIIGFDLCEVAPSVDHSNEWDANVGARVLFKLASLAGAKRL
ncbi:agmatinase [Sphingobacteriales bacterium UPWRP_1]|nr:agmatinase [Sphingobacteriales bacterium UPWRP_1]